MQTRAAHLCLLLTALSVVACQEGPLATEVLVVVDSDLPVGTALARLEAEVHIQGRDPREKALPMPLASQPTPGKYTLPVSFSVAAQKPSDGRQFLVVISGFSATGARVAEQQVITRFRQANPGRLDIFLHGDCADSCYQAGQRRNLTCAGAGVCRQIPVLEELPALGEGELGGYVRGAGRGARGAAPDFGSGASDAGRLVSPDAGPRGDTGQGAVGAPGAAAMPSLGTSGDANASLPTRDGGPDAAAQAAADAGAYDAGGPAQWAVAPIIPTPPASCPALQSGVMQFMGMTLELVAGPRALDPTAPLLLYWHGTQAHAGQVSMLPESVRNEITSLGGLLISPEETLGTGTIALTEWYSGDFAVLDALIACAVREHNIDPRRIYTTGCSSGGVQAGTMAFHRAAYIAAATTNSGGFDAELATTLPSASAHRPVVMAMHGGPTDVVLYSFSELSTFMCDRARAQGGFAVQCDHGGGHCGAPAPLQAAAWQFMKDHPFGSRTEAYANGLPATFPSYCQITR